MCLGLSCLIVSWSVGGALVAPANCRVRPPRDLAVEATTIPSESGSNLATWYLPAKNARATIVLLHPIRGNRRSMLGRAKLFHDVGYSVVMVDLQAHGESPGEHITAGYLERHDAIAAVKYARARNPTHRIGVVGCSLGGAASLLAGRLDIDVIVIESVYPTISDAIHDRIAMRVGPLSYVLSPALICQLKPRLGIAASALRPIDHIAAVGCPILVRAAILTSRQHWTKRSACSTRPLNQKNW